METSGFQNVITREINFVPRAFSLLSSKRMLKSKLLVVLVGLLTVRACLHGGGGPQVGEVTRPAVVEK